MFVKKVKQRLEVRFSCSQMHSSPTLCCGDGVQWYRHAHAKDMPLRSIARMIQTMLYGRRFFPYYVYNILGGIEEDGTCVISCDVLACTRVCTQALERCTPSTLWAHTSAKRVVQRVPHSLSCSPSWIIRCVPFGGTRRTLSSALCCVDLLQEPATCPRHGPSDPFTAGSCSRYCH